MTGKELFEKYTKEPTEYGRLLTTIYLSINDEIFPLLEKAESEGKSLGITEEPKNQLRDELTIQDITLV